MKPQPVNWKWVQKSLVQALVILAAIGLTFGLVSWASSQPASGAPSLDEMNCHEVVPGGVMMNSCDPEPMDESAKHYYHCLAGTAFGALGGVRGAVAGLGTCVSGKMLF